MQFWHVSAPSYMAATRHEDGDEEHATYKIMEHATYKIIFKELLHSAKKCKGNLGIVHTTMNVEISFDFLLLS